jgi:putative restriction endonuclease
MNYISKNRTELSIHNYVLKADSSTGNWVGISKEKISFYRIKYQDDFNIIIFGSQDKEGDFYCIPFISLKHALSTEYMYSNRERWVADIKDGHIRFRVSNIEINISSFYSLDIGSLNINPVKIPQQLSNDFAIENARREISIRLKQSIFRKETLANFENKCCLTGATEQDLLVASHIIPWASRIECRLDPANGLCLLNFYDKLFDKGYFTLSNSLSIIVSIRIRQLSPILENMLHAIDGHFICKPVNKEISVEAIKFHQINIFDKF